MNCIQFLKIAISVYNKIIPCTFFCNYLLAISKRKCFLQIFIFQGMKALVDHHNNDSFIWFQYFKHLIYSHLFWTQRSQSPSGWVKLGHFWIFSCLHISPIRDKVWVAIRWEVSSGVKVADQCTRSHKGYSCDKNVQSSHIQASAAWVNDAGENSTDGLDTHFVAY